MGGVGGHGWGHQEEKREIKQGNVELWVWIWSKFITCINDVFTAQNCLFAQLVYTKRRNRNISNLSGLSSQTQREWGSFSQVLRGILTRTDRWNTSPKFLFNCPWLSRLLLARVANTSCTYTDIHLYLSRPCHLDADSISPVGCRVCWLRATQFRHQLFSWATYHKLNTHSDKAPLTLYTSCGLGAHHFPDN